MVCLVCNSSYFVLHKLTVSESANLWPGIVTGIAEHWHDHNLT